MPQPADAERVIKKLKELIDKYQQLKLENKSLQQKLSASQKTLEESNRKITDLEETVRSLQFSVVNQMQPNDASKKELKMIVNDYLKEIDRCIALLNS